LKRKSKERLKAISHATPNSKHARLYIKSYQKVERFSESYLVDRQVRNDEAKDYARDRFQSEKLWKLSEELIGERFEW